MSKLRTGACPSVSDIKKTKKKKYFFSVTCIIIINRIILQFSILKLRVLTLKCKW